jgi:hypothetical protein
MPEATSQVLGSADLEAFARDGFVRVRKAFAGTDAIEMQQYMWQRLEANFGIRQDDPATWRNDISHLNKTARNRVYDGIAAPRMCGAIDQLLGPGRWTPPRSWGGFLLTFPQSGKPWRLTRKRWHFDGDLARHLEPRAGLAVFTLFSKVEKQGGGTLIVSGSPTLLARMVASEGEEERAQGHRPHNDRFKQMDPWFEELAGLKDGDGDRVRIFLQEGTAIDGVSVKVIELTGEPGDAYLCHPLIFHAASVNTNDVPRFMRVRLLDATAS